MIMLQTWFSVRRMLKLQFICKCHKKEFTAGVQENNDPLSNISSKIDKTKSPIVEIPIIRTVTEPADDAQNPLYEHHIATSLFQKSLLSFGAAVQALRDPHRHDLVAVLGETTGSLALVKMHRSMLMDEEGQWILKEKPRINGHTIDLDALAEFPEDSLGCAYVKFLRKYDITPDSRLPVQFVDDAELAYVMQRYREVHDLFHTVLGMPTNMLGEVVVKWIEAMQTGLPMCAGGALFGPLRFRPKQRQKYVSLYLPWAVRVGRNAKPLMNVYFEKHWRESIHDLRRKLNIEPPPE